MGGKVGDSQEQWDRGCDFSFADARSRSGTPERHLVSPEERPWPGAAGGGYRGGDLISWSWDVSRVRSAGARSVVVPTRGEIIGGHSVPEAVIHAVPLVAAA